MVVIVREQKRAAEPGTGQVGAGQAAAVSSLHMEPDGGALMTKGVQFSLFIVDESKK